ncbi:hypothetical protein O181_040404 [Austropuccinia psidii MF-1]|uniref:CCHC-type domain-containing protein n=1 Tax=Austropuccinia psidii MF-1 TaxID=1389203 RepID=A0A9Q3DC65_9BASI|nr:hypothetical protein [Austropuccinia psidii MF-1]
MHLKDDIKNEIRIITEKMDKINEANSTMPTSSHPFSHIRSSVKPKEELTNPFIKELSHQDTKEVLMKEAPQLKEWPTFRGEEEYINALEDIVTRTKIGRTWKRLDTKSPNKPFIKKDKPKEAFKPNTSNINEQRKCHKCGGIGHLANNCLKKEKINEIVETEDHNDKEEESDFEKDTEESETSESDEIIIINAQINNIDLIFEVLDVNSNLPQAGTSDTDLTNIQDAKLYRSKPEKGMGYTAGKTSISILIVENQEEN